MLKKTVLAALCCGLVAGCSQPLQQYRPVVDPARTNMAQFEADLASCRAIALQAEADLKARQDRDRGKNMIAGLVIGALAGAALGDTSHSAAVGATYGLTAGATATEGDAATGGTRRIIDRCMGQRGHVLLNDPGQGY